MFATTRAVLDRRLARDADWPVLVACSGGGDSTALLLAARGGARRKPLAHSTCHGGSTVKW